MGNQDSVVVVENSYISAVWPNVFELTSGTGLDLDIGSPLAL